MAYVTPAEVAAELGVAAATATGDPRYQRACDAASSMVDAYLGRVDPLEEPTPEPVHQSALELAVDLLRRPAAPYGYFVTDITLASIGPDVLRRVKSLLRPWKQTWGVA
jgi:hypothetical protein